jgi:hypothetical protein
VAGWYSRFTYIHAALAASWSTRRSSGRESGRKAGRCWGAAARRATEGAVAGATGRAPRGEKMCHAASPTTTADMVRKGFRKSQDLMVRVGRCAPG